MPALGTDRKPLRYRVLFPDWRGMRPWPFFMLESLLEARAESRFPTNSRGPDEDVNVYLAHLLSRHLIDPVPAGVVGGGSALAAANAAGSRRQQADRYRRNGDQRLLCLGLYGRGDLARRRRIPWGWDERTVRARDLADGRTCYRAASVLLDRIGPDADGLACVLDRIALRFADYVHVLETLARGHLGLGARLSEDQLRRLLAVE